MINSKELATILNVEHGRVITMVEKVNCSDTYRNLKIENDEVSYELTKEIIVMMLCGLGLEDENTLDMIGKILHIGREINE